MTRKFRAFDPRDGKLLWEATLPYAGNATPITYMAKGRQYVLIQADNARDRKSPPGRGLCRLRFAAALGSAQNNGRG